MWFWVCNEGRNPLILIKKEIAEADEDGNNNQKVPSGQKLKMMFSDKVADRVNDLLFALMPAVRWKNEVFLFKIPNTSVEKNRPSYCPDNHTIETE